MNDTNGSMNIRIGDAFVDINEALNSELEEECTVESSINWQILQLQRRSWFPNIQSKGGSQFWILVFLRSLIWTGLNLAYLNFEIVEGDFTCDMSMAHCWCFSGGDALEKAHDDDDASHFTRRYGRPDQKIVGVAPPPPRFVILFILTWRRDGRRGVSRLSDSHPCASLCGEKQNGGRSGHVEKIY